MAGLRGVQLLVEVAADAREPLELEDVLVGVDLVALRHVRVHDRDAIHDGLENADVLVVGSFAEAVEDALRLAQRQRRDAVVALHAAKGGVVARIAEGVDGELVVLHLGLLQAQDVGPMLAEPVDDEGQASADGINVPGSDLHSSIRLPRVGASARRSSETPGSPRRLRSSGPPARTFEMQLRSASVRPGRGSHVR